MGNMNDMGENVNDMLNKHPGSERAVIETCYMFITDVHEDHEDIKRMLLYGIGVSIAGDAAIMEWINKDKQFT